MEAGLRSLFGFDRVLNLIEPSGETGKFLRHNLPVWKPGQEALLKKEYARLQTLLDSLKAGKKLSGQLHSCLVNLNRLPLTLKALEERPLSLPELFEVKKLTHYVLLLRKLCTQANLLPHYPLPDLAVLYEILDPDRLETPAFSLSPAFDPKLAKLLGQKQELLLALREEEEDLLNQARTAIGLNKTVRELVVSRSQTALLSKLQSTSFYSLISENFANLTFQLADSPALLKLRRQLSSLETRLATTEEDVLAKLSRKVRPFAKSLAQATEIAALLDWDFAKARFTNTYNCTLPNIITACRIRLDKAVNLPVRMALESSGRRYQPLDLDFSAPLNVLTGPNMGGKTTALLSLGLLCTMAQHALPLPAAFAELPLFDTIWFNQDGLQVENLSSFGREIVSLTAVLQKKGRTLLLLDELAKGTNPAEGEALLTAILAHCAAMPGITLAATHFDQPARLPQAKQFAIKGIETASLKQLLQSIPADPEAQISLLNRLMDYNLAKQTAKSKPPRNAISIAAGLGLPAEIIQSAQNLLSR